MSDRGFLRGLGILILVVLLFLFFGELLPGGTPGFVIVLSLQSLSFIAAGYVSGTLLTALGTGVAGGVFFMGVVNFWLTGLGLPNLGWRGYTITFMLALLGIFAGGGLREVLRRRAVRRGRRPAA